MITKRKWNNLSEKMSSLGINEESLVENFIKGSGKGGQKVNKTSSCVQLKYKDFEIKCQKTRSQTDNRYWARIELCERISFQRLDLFLVSSKMRCIKFESKNEGLEKQKLR